jgi:hypothetical protein
MVELEENVIMLRFFLLCWLKWWVILSQIRLF